MQRASDQLLAGSALADDQHGSFDACRLRHLLIYVDHFGRCADDLGFRKSLRQLGSDGPGLRELELLFDAMEDSQHLIDDEWLADVIECAVVDGVNGGFPP